MIVIEESGPLSKIIGNTLVASNINVIGWKSSVIPLYRMLEDKKPDLLIYGPEASMQGMQYMKQRFPSTVVAYLGDHPADECLSDIVIGESELRSSIDLPTNIYDITNILRGNKKPYMECELATFTESIKQAKLESNLDLFQELISIRTRFFGSQKLDTHAYLGSITDQERADIVKSCSIYVDMTGDYWHKSVMMRTVPIVFTNDTLPGINTFNDIESLHKAIQETKKGNYNIKEARESIVNNSGFNFCYNLFSALGAQEAAASILKAKEEVS
jgi:hypothetical protein